MKKLLGTIKIAIGFVYSSYFLSKNPEVSEFSTIAWFFIAFSAYCIIDGIQTCIESKEEVKICSMLEKKAKKHKKSGDTFNGYY